MEVSRMGIFGIERDDSGTDSRKDAFSMNLEGDVSGTDSQGNIFFWVDWERGVWGTNS